MGAHNHLWQLPGVIGGADIREPQIQHTWRVGAVDQRVDTAPGQRGDDARDGQHQPGLAGHMIDQRQPGAGAGALEYRVHGLIRIGQRERDSRDDHPGARPPGHILQRVAAGVVFVVCGQEFVAGRERQRAQHRVDPAGGVRHPGDVGGRCIQEGRKLGAGCVEQAFEVTHEELHRLTFHPQTDPVLFLQHGPRTSAERAMVEKDHFRVQGPAIASLFRVCRHCCASGPACMHVCAGWLPAEAKHGHPLDMM